MLTARDYTLLYGEPNEIRPQAHVETPQHRRIEWVDACGGTYAPLGKLPPGMRVGVIGGGPAGMTTAIDSIKAGMQVTLIEAHVTKQHAMPSNTELDELVCHGLEKKVLLKCALVSTQWYETSMLFLFKDIPELKTQRQKLSFRRLILEDYH
ncbi:hypothetical protein BGZ82_003342 [Podila clonocystis]|nr:hypothetical protein BGZ82_003342 [Podila clonocystis]